MRRPLRPAEERILTFAIDPTEPAACRLDKFTAFCAYFGPFPGSLATVKRMFGSPYYFGAISHEESVRLLGGAPVGSFLVRQSQSKVGDFALETKLIDPSTGLPFVLPIRLENRHSGGFVIHETEGGDRSFTSLTGLLAAYSPYLTSPLANHVFVADWFWGDLSSTQAGAILGGCAEGTYLVRYSSQPGCYSASFVEDGVVRHSLIEPVPHIPGAFQVAGDHAVYPTLPALVVGFSGGLQRPYVNETNRSLRDVLALAQVEHRMQVQEQEREAKLYAPLSSITPPALSSSGSQRRPHRPPRPSPGTPATAQAASESVQLTFLSDGESVKAGTLAGLIDYLLENSASDYAKAFLISYHSFAKPMELLRVLGRRYTYYATVNRDDMHSRKLRLRVVGFLKTWVERERSGSVINTDEFVSGYTRLVKDTIRRVDGEADAAELMETLRCRLDAIRRGDSFSPTTFILSAQPPKPIMPKRGTSDWTGIATLEVARQLTLVEQQLFMAIEPSELLGLAWTKKDKAKRAPNLLKFIDRFNLVSTWVAHAILSEADLKRRVKVYEKFLELCVELDGLHNYNACMEIAAALESAAIYRLKKTKAKVKDSLERRYGEVHAKLSRASNFKTFREVLRTCPRPTIPYMGMYQSDLTFIEEGNDDELDDPETGVTLINFHKRRLVASVILSVEEYQSTPYTLQRVPEAQSLLETAIRSASMDDDRAYKISLKLEPRGE
jgi:hypothetical protein